MTSRALRNGRSIRRVAAVLLVAALVATAGCSSLLSGGGGAAADAQLDSVPAKADTLAFVDVQGMLGDDTLRSIANTYYEEQAEAYGEYYDGPTSVEGFLSQIENESGISPKKLDTVTFFASAKKQADSGDGEFAGMIVTSRLSKSALKSALDETGTSYSTETYKGATLWVSQGGVSGSQDVVGWLGDGTFVLGNRGSVEAVIDVRNGDADAVSGELRKTFEDTRDGYVKFAMSVPQGQFDADRYQSGQFDTSSFNSVHTVSGAFYVEGSTVGVVTHLATNSSSAASDIEDVTSGAVSLYKGFVKAESVEKALEKVEVTKEGTTVTITYENSESNIEAAIEAAFNTSSTSSIEASPLA